LPLPLPCQLGFDQGSDQFQTQRFGIRPFETLGQADAIVLYLKFQCFTCLFQHDIDTTLSVIRKCVFVGVGKQLVDRQTERGRLFDTDFDRIGLNIDVIQMGVTTANPLGLIINELVTNAIEHAFAGRSGGEIDNATLFNSQFVFLRNTTSDP
jgi:hypothetical protein